MSESQHLHNTAWAAIGAATVGAPKRAQYWTAWERHCWLYQADSRGKPPPNAQGMLLTFAVAMREGQFGLGHQVKVQSVYKALRAIGQKYVLDGHHEP
jgi:hypothetical protein